MKYIFVILLILVSCATKPTSIFGEDNEYSNYIESNSYYGFGFEYKNQTYEFIVPPIDKNTKCKHFEGYRDHQLTYKISEDQFREFSKIYTSKLSIADKINKAATEIEKYKASSLVCKYDLSLKKINYEEFISSAIVYGPMVVLVAPIWVPQIVIASANYKSLQSKIKKIQLGMQINEIQKIMDMSYSIEEVEGHEILSYAITNIDFSPSQKIVLVFKDQRLVAYVFGMTSAYPYPLKKVK